MVRLAPPILPLQHRRYENSWPNVYRWCKLQSFTAKSGQNCTHTLLDSRTVGFGVLDIPDDRYEEFLTAYISSIDRQDLVYLNEHIADKQAPRRMYLDCDMHFKGDMALVDEKELFEDMVLRIYNIVAAFSTDANILLVLSAGMTSETDAAVSPPVPSTKSRLGLHFIWPKFYVTQPVALAIRRAVVTHLVNQLQTTFQANAIINGYEVDSSWPNLVDEAVLTTQNLRMPYSRKCKNGGTVGQCVCGSGQSLDRGCICFRGVVDLGRPYLPLLAVMDGTLQSIEHYDTEFVVTNATIRVTKDTPQSVCNVKATDYMDLYAKDVSPNTKGAKVVAKLVESPEIQSLISSYCLCMWSSFFDADKPVVAKRKGAMYFVACTVPGACPNARNGHHTGSPTFLVFTSDGKVVQKCMSKKNTKRRFQRCDRVDECDIRCEDMLNRNMVAALFKPASKQRKSSAIPRRRSGLVNTAPQQRNKRARRSSSPALQC